MQLLIDPSTKRAVTDLKTDSDVTFGSFEFGETVPIEVGIVDRIPSTPDGRIWQPRDLSGWTFRAALGLAYQPPIAGTFTMTFGANTTGALAFDITAAGLSTALNALASIAGQLIVTGTNPYFTLKFINVGAKTLFSSDVSNLAPHSLQEHNTLVDGDASHAEIQTFRFFQNPATFADVITGPIASSIAVNLIEAGGSGVNHKVRVVMDPIPYAGSWSLTVPHTAVFETVLLPFDADEVTVKNAIEANPNIAADDVTVVREADGQYLIGFAGTVAGISMGTITASGGSLKVIDLLTGTLDLRTPGVELMLGTAESVDCFFEVEGTPVTGDPQKLFRFSVTVVPPVITPASVIPTPIVSYYTKAEVDAFVAVINGNIPIKQFANLAAIAAATPDFVGQLAFDQATNQYHTGTALSVGGYSDNFEALEFNAANVVSSANELIIGGTIDVPETITAPGTTGAQTINKISGSVNFAAGATSLVLTNNTITTASRLFLQIAANDANVFGARYVPANGSATITLTAAPAAETRVNFWVLK